MSHIKRNYTHINDNLRFLNDAARRHWLESSVKGSRVFQVHSNRSQGSFYTLEAYVTLRNLMDHEDRQTHTVTAFDASYAALITDKIWTREEVIATLQP